MFEPSSAVIRSECPLAVTDTCERVINKSLPGRRCMAVSPQSHMDSVDAWTCDFTVQADEKQLLRLDWLVMAAPAARPVITMIGVIFFYP